MVLFPKRSGTGSRTWGLHGVQKRDWILRVPFQWNTCGLNNVGILESIMTSKRSKFHPLQTAGPALSYVEMSILFHKLYRGLTSFITWIICRETIDVKQDTRLALRSCMIRETRCILSDRTSAYSCINSWNWDKGTGSAIATIYDINLRAADIELSPSECWSNMERDLQSKGFEHRWQCTR